MDNFQSSVIALIRGALTGEKQVLPPDFSLDKAVSTAGRHGILTMLYYGALACGIEKSDPMMPRLFHNACKTITTSERQMYEIKQIFEAFDQNSIEYMPLKGTLLKEMYPKPEMRSMGDADILIKMSQYPAIKPIMQQLGFSEKLESDHELVWQKPSAYIELHKRLIPSYNKDYYAYYGDGWNLAKHCNGTRYSMTNEDEFIFLFTHFSKHYRDAGIGIRHFVDLWVYRNNKPALNETYLKKELTKLSLYEFYVNIMDTLAVWFDSKPATDITDFITAIIFNSGVYGTDEAWILSKAVRKSKSSGTTKGIKVHSFFNLLFLPYDSMCVKYPVLIKCPILLPVMWIYRIVTTVLFKPKAIQKNQQRITTLNEDNIKDYQTALNFVGLDFNFKE